MNVCPYCNKEILTEEETRICGKCGVAYHKSCWDANGGCATFACENNISAGTAPKTPSFCAKCGTALNEMGQCSVCSTGSTVTAKKKFNLTSKKLMMCIIIAATVLVLLTAGLIFWFVFRDTRGAGSPEEAFENFDECVHLISGEEINLDKTASLVYDSIPEDLLEDYMYSLELEGEDQKTVLKEALRESLLETEYHENSFEFKIKSINKMTEKKKKEVIEDYFDDYDIFYNFETYEITEVYEVKYAMRYINDDGKTRTDDATNYIIKYKGSYYDISFSAVITRILNNVYLDLSDFDIE